MKVVTRLVDPPASPQGLDLPWSIVEQELKLTLPDDYKEFIDTYGSGSINGLVGVWNYRDPSYFNMPLLEAISGQDGVIQWYKTVGAEGDHTWPYAMYPTSGGLLPFVTLADVYYLNWATSGPPNDWDVVFWFADGHEFIRLEGDSFSEFLVKLLQKEYKRRDLITLDPPYEFTPTSSR
jgi:hypothetical protein